MKFFTSKKEIGLLPGLERLLLWVREHRNFDEQLYLDAKFKIFDEFYRKAKLDTAVIAVSGGIDSALVLKMLDSFRKRSGAHLKFITPITLPVMKEEYTKNQPDSVKRATEVASSCGLEIAVLNLTPAYLALKGLVDEGLKMKGEPWASGQLVSYLRTPTIYYTTSLMTQSGKASVVVGTTNRDEGAYLGYVGKASDGMVDTQLISDLHKSEVRRLSKFLGVPQSILDVAPSGDMFDGRIDEEVFGASYDFVELFLGLKSIKSETVVAWALQSLNPAEKEQYERLASKLEDLHRYNSHKYNVGSPAVHFDVLESGVKGGWKYGYAAVPRKANKSFFVNVFDIEKIESKLSSSVKPQLLENRKVNDGNCLVLKNVLDQAELNMLLTNAEEHGYVPVGLDGFLNHYKEGDVIGSYRASIFEPEFAEVLFSRIAPYLDSVIVKNDLSVQDGVPGGVYRPIGVSPYMRFIKYQNGGKLVPHYDAPFEYDDKMITLKSFVLYLQSENVTGGRTRFISDSQNGKKYSEKDYSDWTNFADESQVIFSAEPNAGGAIVFDHRILHDGEAVTGDGTKVILRTDIVYALC